MLLLFFVVVLVVLVILVLVVVHNWSHKSITINVAVGMLRRQGDHADL